MPFSPLRMLLFVLALTALVVFVQIGLVTVAFDKLGLSKESAYLLLLCTLVGSVLNVPVFSLRVAPEAQPRPPDQPPIRLPFFNLGPVPDKTIVAVNVGGAVVPAAFSLYLLSHNPMNPLLVALGVTAVAIIAYKISGPVLGIGIGMPTLIAPIAAALIAVILDPEHRAAFAYISGTLGVLIGADLLRMKDIRKLGAPFASIGGAGTFDGIYVTGLLAVLLA